MPDSLPLLVYHTNNLIYILSEIRGVEEISVETLFKGMEFFFDLIKENNIDFPNSTIREYIIKT
ncbi:MAG: hypothetical protein ACOYIF_07485 [Acetivibrionales bacterium]